MHAAASVLVPSQLEEHVEFVTQCDQVGHGGMLQSTTLVRTDEPLLPAQKLRTSLTEICLFNT